MLIRSCAHRRLVLHTVCGYNGVYQHRKALQSSRTLVRAAMAWLNYKKSGPPSPPTGYEKRISVHGHEWVDNFARFADEIDSELLEYLNAETMHTRKELLDQDVFKALRAEIEARQEYPSVSALTLYNGYMYYRKIDPLAQQMVDCRRSYSKSGQEESIGPEEVILDHRSLSDRLGGFASVSKLKVSPNARYLVYTVDLTGGDIYEAHIVDLSNMDAAPIQVIDNVCSVEWTSDSGSVLYTQPNHLLRPHRLFLRNLNDFAESNDRLLFEENDERYFLDVSTTKNDQYLTINMNSKTCSEVWLLPTTLDTVDPVLVKPRSELPTGNCIYFMEHRKDRFYIVTNDNNAYNYKVMSAPESDPTRWTEFFPMDSKKPIEDAEFFANMIVLHRRDEMGLPELCFVDFDNPTKPEIVCPFQNNLCGSVFSLIPHSNTDFNATTFSFSTTTPLIPNTDWEYDFATKTLTAKSHQQVTGVPHFASINYRAHRKLIPSVHGPAPDKCAVAQSCQSAFDCPIGSEHLDGNNNRLVKELHPDLPVTLIHRDGIKMDGSANLLLIAYGAYGESLEPEFRAEHLVLLRRGWVIAYCHVRGGGELGKNWHEAGKGLMKGNSVTDLSRCTEWLLNERYTSRGRLIGAGSSAGATLFASLCNQQPGLFAGIILHVPFVGVLSSMLDAELPLTVHERDEWGDPIACPMHFSNLSKLCPTHNIKDRAYPPMLITTSMDDERVQFWQPTKYVANLRTLDSVDQNQLFLLVEDEGGHFGSGQDRHLYELAFMFRVLGLPSASLRGPWQGSQ